MKKIIFLLTMLSGTFMPAANAQFNYKTAYDLMEPNDPYDGTSNSITLADGESYVLRSYLVMYKATLDINYLHKFVAHSSQLLNQRNHTRKCFIRNDGFTRVYDNGMITFPLAEFAYLISVEYPALASTTMLISVSHYSGSPTYTTFGTYATYLKVFSEETMNAFNESNLAFNYANMMDCWDTRSGVSAYFNSNAESNQLIDNNMQCAMALTLSKLYQLTGTYDYLYKSRTIAGRFKNMLSLVGNHYEWHSRFNEPYPTTNWEDLDHGAIEIELANHFFKNNITTTGLPGAPLVFNATDIDRLARSVTESAYREATQINYSVHGDNDWYPYDPANPYWSIEDIIRLPLIYRESAGQWLPLAESLEGNIDNLGRDLFHITAYMLFHRWDTDPGFTQVRMISLAYMCYYQSKGYTRFNYVDQDITYGSTSGWAGVAIGNFYGTDKHVVGVRNLDGDFFLHKMNGTDLTYLTAYTSPGSSSLWKGVAAGNFNGSGAEEFVALRNADGDIFMYGYNGTSISQTASYDAGAASNWAGIAAGDFDNNGTDEFVGIRNFDSGLMLFNYSGGTINYISNYFGTASSGWVGIASGDFDNDGKDEVAAARTLDDRVYIFDIDAGVISPKAAYFAPPAGVDVVWDGITAGDFGSSGGDEIIVHRADNGDYYFLQYDGTSITMKHHEYYPGAQLAKNFAAGQLMGTSADELVYLRNQDGDMIVCTVDPVTVTNSTGQSFKSMPVVAPLGEQESTAGFTLQDPAIATGEINVYPIPVKDLLYINAKENPVTGIVITDLSGKIVYHSAACNGSVDLSMLQPGLYILKFNAGGEKTTKIIKQ